MLQEACPEMRLSRTYPRGKIEKVFGAYFTSSIAFMVAYAIAGGAQEISLFGIDMLGSDEYVYQRPCVEYLVGFARGRGITVNIPEKSALIKSTYTYGYDFGAHKQGSTLQDRMLDEIAEWRAMAIEADNKLTIWKQKHDDVSGVVAPREIPIA
jgi:hypothetical protein